MSAEREEMQATVIEEFPASNALLGIVRITIRPVSSTPSGGVPVARTRISISGENHDTEVAELDDQATSLLANVLLKDGHSLPKSVHSSALYRCVQKVWSHFWILIKGGLVGRQQHVLLDGKSEWWKFQGEVTRLLRRKGAAVVRAREGGGDDA
ncbi:hypothetical protein [Micromonospora sp. WMMD714]|uniref:hypothetical protein n=1 Tax=Micromonospora sp. WMMD714 TaxID=3016097 RepID=UPI00249B836B|nr:hypothetical protein [Micromonospora sp. WMMD714]WFE64146.1 hypothetical protein O7625_13040 [Micromonospora sp. WMMD714]